MTKKTCKNCENDFIGSYCNSCGQKEFKPHDASITSIVEESFHFITHFESSFFRTLKAVLFYPSRLTKDYCEGKRKRYFKPISMYLFVVILYLIFPIFSGLNMDMQNYTSMSFFGGIIQHQITSEIESDNSNFEDLSEKFKMKSSTTSKLLLLLLIPFSSIFIKLLYYKREQNTYRNLILSTEINIVYMLVFFLIFPLLFLLIVSLLHIEFVSDDLVGFVVTLLFGVYCGHIFRKIYKSKAWVALLKGIAFAFIHTFIILTIYKFLVFEITFLLV